MTETSKIDEIIMCRLLNIFCLNAPNASESNPSGIMITPMLKSLIRLNQGEKYMNFDHPSLHLSELPNTLVFSFSNDYVNKDKQLLKL